MHIYLCLLALTIAAFDQFKKTFIERARNNVYMVKTEKVCVSSTIYSRYFHSRAIFLSFRLYTQLSPLNRRRAHFPYRSICILQYFLSTSFCSPGLLFRFIPRFYIHFPPSSSFSLFFPFIAHLQQQPFLGRHQKYERKKRTRKKNKKALAQKSNTKFVSIWSSNTRIWRKHRHFRYADVGLLMKEKWHRNSRWRNGSLTKHEINFWKKKINSITNLRQISQDFPVVEKSFV